MFRFRVHAALALATTLCLAAPARADHLPLGTFLGSTNAFENDTPELIESLFGFDPGSIMLLARIPGPEGLPIEGTMVDGLSYDNFVLNDDNEPAGGDWFFDGPDIVHLVAVKAGPNWGVWQFDDGVNQGGFNTLQMQPGNPAGDQRGFGDITVYKIVAVPEPSSLALCGVVLAAGLGARRRIARA